MIRAGAVLAVSLIGVGVAATTAVAPRAHHDAILVAVEAPMSGEGSQDGLDQLRGVELAARQVNAQGGVLGRRVKVVRADDQGDPDLALPTFRHVARMNADALIGPYNSSVAVINLRSYSKARIIPVQMASTDATSGIGINVQPKTRQIAPVEFDWIQRTWAPRHVAILAGQSTFLAGQADRLQAALSGAGVAVTRIPITAGQDDYAAEVGQALASGADAVYVSTKIAEGVKIATLLAASASRPKCFLGFANQDPSVVEKAGIAVSQTCVFSGVPAPAVFPTAKAYVRDYRRAFGIEPATWGVFTYDSARLLFQGMRQAGTVNYAAVMKRLRRTVNFRGATGTITIDPVSGDRRKVAVAVLTVDDAGRFVLAPG